MLEPTDDDGLFCNVCSHQSSRRRVVEASSGRARIRFASVDDLVARAGVRRDELVTLADIGALNSLGYDRRSALWQAERAVRLAGELFTTINAETPEYAENVFEKHDSADSANSAFDVVDESCPRSR